MLIVGSVIFKVEGRPPHVKKYTSKEDRDELIQGYLLRHRGQQVEITIRPGGRKEGFIRKIIQESAGGAYSDKKAAKAFSISDFNYRKKQMDIYRDQRRVERNNKKQQ